MNSCCKNGNLEKARDLFQEMLQKGVLVKAIAYEAVIRALCTKGEYDVALGILGEMGEEGLELSFESCRDIACGFLEEKF